MAVPTTRQIARMNKGRTTRGLQIGDRLQGLDTDGSISSTAGAALTGTTGDSFTLASGESDGTFVLSMNTTGSNHAYTLKIPVTTQAVTMLLPDVASDTLVSLTATQTLSAKTLTTPTISATGWTNAQHSHTAANSGGAIAAQSASTGTTSNTFDVDSDNITGILQLKTTTGGTLHTVVLTNATTTADRTITLPDLTGTVALLTGAQTFATKTLTAPVINAGTLTGTFTISGTPTISGTWTDLGAVTTVDINGGTVDGTNIGATTPGTGAFSTLSATGASTLGDDATLAAGKDLILAKGTGEIKINANTSGSLIILPTAATAQAVTLATAAQTGGAATVSIPDMAGVSTSFVLAGAANTFTALQIIDMDDEVDAVEDLLTLKHTSSNNQATAGDGIGISFVLENATGTALEEEWASIDVLSTTITNGSEDGDIQISQMLGGVVTPSLLLDASAQEVAIGQSSADADGMNALRIYPHTTAARGSLVLTSAINGSGNFVTTVTQATDVSESQTITIADADGATDTFSMLATAESFSAVKTFTAAPVVTITDAGTTTVTDVATFTHLGGTPDVGLGLGLSFIVENDTDGTTQCASLDIINTTVAKGTMDTDILFSTMLAGTVREVLRVDASAQELVVGVSEAVGDQINTIRINPHTTASRGALLLTSAINGTGNFTTTVTQATDVSESQVITIADAAGATDTFSMLATAETFSAVKTFSAAPIIHYSGTDTNAVRDLLTIKNESSGTPAAGLGIGVSFQLTDLTGATVEEQASMHVSMATVTSAAEDADIIFNQNLAGAITQTVHFDSVNQEVVIGRDATDANGFNALRIWPLTELKGSILIEPTDNTGDDTVKLTNSNTGGDITVALPATSGTLAILGANSFTAAQTMGLADAATNTTVFPVVLNHTSSSTEAALFGVGVDFQLSDASNNVQSAGTIGTEWAVATHASEDADMVFSMAIDDGTVTEVMRLDSTANSLMLGPATGGSKCTKVTVHPITTAKGSLVLSAVDNDAANVATTIQNGQAAGASVITLPGVTGTLAILGSNTFTAAQTCTISDAATNTTVFPAIVNHATSATAAASFGVGIDFYLEDATPNAAESAGSIGVEWYSATHGSQDADMVFKVAIDDDTVTEMLRIDAFENSLMLGAATGGSKCTDLVIHPTTTANGSLILHAANNASADVKTIIQNGQSGAESTFTLPTAVSGTIALTAQADGTIARSDLTEDALAHYGIPLTQIMSADGTPLGISETAGDHFLDFGTNIFQLRGEEAISETETSESYWQFVLPPEYVSAGDVTVRIRCKIDGAGTDNGSNVDVEVFEQADGAIGGDIQATGVQTFAAKTTWYSKDFSVTASTLVAGDILNVVLTSNVIENGASALAFYADPPKMLLDVKG